MKLNYAVVSKVADAIFTVTIIDKNKINKDNPEEAVVLTTFVAGKTSNVEKAATDLSKSLDKDLKKKIKNYEALIIHCLSLIKYNLKEKL